MMWAGGNPNFNENTGEFVSPDSPEWRDPNTGEYVNRLTTSPMSGGFNRPNLGQNMGDTPEGFTGGGGGRAITQWYNKNTDQFWDAPSTGYTPGKDSGWVLSDSFDPYENTTGDIRPPMIGIGGNGYSSNPVFDGLDMSGFNPRNMQTMDMITYYINGKEQVGSSSGASEIEKYLQSIGKGDAFTRKDNSSDFMEVAVQPELQQPAPMWTGDTPNAPWANQPTQTQQPFTNQQPYFTAGNNQGISNLAYSGSQLAGTSAPGLEKQNLDYALSQLGMMTGGYGNGTGGYTQSGGFGSAANPQAGVTYGGGDGEADNFGSSSDNYRSPQDYQDYLTGGRSFLQGALGLFGPIGTGLGIATDYDMGFSTLSPNTGENLGYTNPFTDEYSAFYNENYAGPGSDMAFTQNLMYPTEQRDMLINQQSFDILPEQTEESFTDWLGGMFGGNTLNYDPDMDLERSDWSDTTPAAPGSFDNRLEGPWSGTDTYKNSLEGYANAEQINKDFNEMLNWEDTDPQSVQEFTKMFSSLNNLTEAEFNKLALEGLRKDEEKKIADVLAKEQTRQEAITDIKSSLSNLGSVMTEQKEWTATQFEDYQGAMDFQIDNIKGTLSSQLSLNEAQRSILRDAMMEMTSNSVQSINAQLMSISDTNSKQYNDLLSKLETVEGDLTQQIEDAYTGPNTGYNPITDTAPDTGGTSPEDLGGTSTTDDDAQAEIDSGYDDPSESSGPSSPGSGYTGSDGGGGSFDSGSSGTDDSDASSETGDYSSYDSPDDSSGPSTGGWGW